MSSELNLYNCNYLKNNHIKIKRQCGDFLLHRGIFTGRGDCTCPALGGKKFVLKFNAKKYAKF